MTKFSAKLANIIEAVFGLIIAAILILYLLPFFDWVPENVGITIVVGVIAVLVIIVIGLAGAVLVITKFPR